MGVRVQRVSLEVQIQKDTVSGLRYGYRYICHIDTLSTPGLILILALRHLQNLSARVGISALPSISEYPRSQNARIL